MSYKHLRSLAYQCLLELSTEEGINASGKDGVFGCIFGRDSAITILKILKVHSKQPSLELLSTARKGLLTLASLQGTEFNIECGEEPGKFIHEFRKKEETEHYFGLVNHPTLPWFIQTDGTIKNYDSIDSTPLTLIALYKYWQITQDDEFLITVLPAVEKGLNWIITFGDLDKDLLLEYDFPVTRKHGGLLVQSWTDSHESLRQSDGNMPKYPIAPVEAQGYAWLALKLWGDFYKNIAPEFSKKLLSQSIELKKRFNEMFLIKDKGITFASQALDGDKNSIGTITGNPLICLWATYDGNGIRESIIEDKYIPEFVERTFQDDLFDDEAGIRTMSTSSQTFNPNTDSYHNGSFWPVLNGLVHEGLQNWGYEVEAKKLWKASLKPIQYFGSPIELYIKKDGKLFEYLSPSGQTSCKYQAWSAAATLDWLTL